MRQLALAPVATRSLRRETAYFEEVLFRSDWELLVVAGRDRMTEMTTAERRTTVLLQRWHAGDRHALEALVETHMEWISLHVKRRLGPALRARAETGDYVQDAVLEGAGFIKDVRAETQEGHLTLAMTIRYDDRGKPLIDGIRRVSKPGRRVYVGARDVWKVRNGLGISVISTSKGILSDEGAREASIGGEVVCEVW